MKKQSLFILTIFLCLAPVVFADWNPGDPHKWLQNPDQTTNGIDIRVDNRGGQRAIGDDFQCTETGPITDVHLWTSWKDDITGPISVITLKIYSDDPVGLGGSDPGNTFSKPDIQLWSRPFTSSEFTQRLYYTLPSPQKEGWWDPRGGGYIASGDSKIYQINFNIPPADAYFQEGSPTHPVIYWLVVEVQLPMTGSTMFGWKTRSYVESHFNDDAVWRSNPESPWVELKYPSGHQLYPQSIDMAFVITSHHTEPNTMDFGDAPEGSNAIAYPATGVTGSFPTCKTIGPAGWVQHTNFGAYFGPSVDFELDGNAGLCPALNCFPPYNQDECFNDGDAGLIFPQPYTIDAALNVIPCPKCTGSSLGNTCQTATWGANIDIDVHNHMPSVATGYVNLLIDWNQNGQWSGVSTCPTASAPEHALVNFPVPNPYDGPLSNLLPPGFLIGPNAGYVWARFSITEVPVRTDWDGEGSFEDGETEDYLLLVSPHMESFDFGDANDGPYPTKLANLGARHIIVLGILMGAQIDSEADGQPNATATGDDISNLADEDGVTFTTALMPGNWGTVNVDLTNCAAGLGLFLNAWVDFNSNGSWADAGDQIFASQPVTAGVINSLSFWVPPTAQAGKTTFARFRLSTMQVLSYTGLAPDGEVEDYTVAILKKPLAEHLKWSQPPLEIYPQNPELEYCGWNEPSWTQNLEEFPPHHRVADDFRCIGSMPVTSIHWWGSFIGWTSESLPPVMPIKWNLKFYANVPAIPGGDPNFSHPGALLWEVTVPSVRVMTDFNGFDYHPEYGTEACFQHYLKLNPDEYFKQGQYDSNTVDHTYWLGITAVYPQGGITINYPWGWKTRPQHWMDDAVKYEGRVVGGHFDPGSGEWIPDVLFQFWPMKDPITGESVDAAFELDTDPNYIKWEQPYTGIRNWSHYEDMLSMAYDDGVKLTKVRQAADDWQCKRRTPVTSIVWWGSYLGYNYQPCVSTPTPPLPIKPDYFMINIWTDVPAGATPSHPGTVIWGYKAYNYDEVMVGYDKNPVGLPPPREAVFRYSVRLPESNWFKQRKVNQIYWVSIMAVYNPANPLPYQWGWTNHRHFFNDDAVSGHWSGPTWVWDEIFDETGVSADLSFMLFTDPAICVTCADYNWSGLVEFNDFAFFALDWLINIPPGGYANGDLDCNGIVNVADLKIFCQQWLQTCP
jgi:hypothetical protein